MTSIHFPKYWRFLIVALILFAMALLIYGCGQKSESMTSVVACHVKPTPVFAGSTANVELTVQNPQPRMVYHWQSSEGTFRPEDTENPYSTFNAPSKPGNVRITVALLKNGKTMDVHEELISIVSADGASPNFTNPPPESIPTLSIAITEIPICDSTGGSTSFTRIAGRVSGDNPSRFRVVIYAKTDDWWVQPNEAQPLTFVEADGTWGEDIHRGSEYAALVVLPSFHIPSRPPVLPRKDGQNVLAITRVRGRAINEPSTSNENHNSP